MDLDLTKYWEDFTYGEGIYNRDMYSSEHLNFIATITI